MKKQIIIDTDPGIDDAVALAIALFSKELDVKLITTVAGNVSVDLVTKNTLKLLSHYKKEVTVAKGASRPLNEPFIDASEIHGASGLEGYDFPAVNDALLSQSHAVEEMYKTIMNAEQKMTLLAIGPLTNIALLIRTYPECLDKIEEVVIMGGAYTRGNKGVMSEFNIATDPEAADILFKSGLKITMVGLEIGLKALILPEDSQKIKEMNVVGDMFYHLFKKYRGGSFNKGLKMYDATAVAYLLRPDMFQVQDSFVAIELIGTYTRGATVVDLNNRLAQKENCTVCLDIDPDKFKEWMLSSIDAININ